MKQIVVLIVLGSLSFGIGCQVRDEEAEKLGRQIGSATESSESKAIKKFNNSIVAEYNRVQTQFNKIQPAIKTVNNGGYKDATPLKQALADVRQAVKTAKSTLKATSVPEGPDARVVVQALHKFLAELTNLTDREFPPLIAIMENGSLTPSQKLQRYGQKRLDATKVVNKARVELFSSQSFFATKYKLENRIRVRGRR